MTILILCFALIALAFSMAIVDFSQLLKRLGFKEEAKDLIKDALAYAMLGFILFYVIQAKLQLHIVPSFNTELLY